MFSFFPCCFPFHSVENNEHNENATQFNSFDATRSHISFIKRIGEDDFEFARVLTVSVLSGWCLCRARAKRKMNYYYFVSNSLSYIFLSLACLSSSHSISLRFNWILDLGLDNFTQEIVYINHCNRGIWLARTSLMHSICNVMYT